MYEELVRDTNNSSPHTGNRVAGSRSGGIIATGLGKRFGDLWALRELDLEVAPGKVLGLLGHNGAGKTTAIRILTTLCLPTTGRATVAGFDVVDEAAAVRNRIGVAAQQATVDGLMSAWANLEMVARLHHLPKAVARRRADELLERLDLTGAADRLVKTFSGGMRRRLDLAASLVASPDVLFLDEPTTGPRSPQPQRSVADAARSRSRGHDDRAHHAVPRRGRSTRRRHRRARPRPDGRRRHAGRAEGADRQRPHRRQGVSRRANWSPPHPRSPRSRPTTRPSTATSSPSALRSSRAPA